MVYERSRAVDKASMTDQSDPMQRFWANHPRRVPGGEPNSATGTKARRWRAASVVMLVSSIAFPVAIVAILYRGCDSDCGGGFLILVSYFFAIASSLLLLGFATGAVRRGYGHEAAPTITFLWLLLGSPVLVFGSWGVIWHVQTGEWDNVFFYSAAIVIPALFGVVASFGLWQLRPPRASARQGNT